MCKPQSLLTAYMGKGATYVPATLTIGRAGIYNTLNLRKTQLMLCTTACIRQSSKASGNYNGSSKVSTHITHSVGYSLGIDRPIDPRYARSKACPANQFPISLESQIYRVGNR